MITSLSLENFKSFRHANLEFGPLTLLIGPNASGKSNLRDAFRFLHAMGRGYSLAEILEGKYEGGRRTWPGIRGGAEEIHRLGKLKQGRQWYSRRPSNWPKVGSSIDVEFGTPKRFRYRVSFSATKSRMPRIVGEMLLKGQAEQMVYSTHPAQNSKQTTSVATVDVWYPGRGRGGKRKATLSSERSVLTQLLKNPKPAWTSSRTARPCVPNCWIFASSIFPPV